MLAADRDAWAGMRAALWPEADAGVHAGEIDGILNDDDYWGFIAEAVDGGAVGFAEVAIRKYANGCDSRPVPFLEGIWVKPEFRRLGVGTQLLGHVGALLVQCGFSELGSDSELANAAAHASHKGWGFAETERVVYFRKPLNGSRKA